MTTRREKGGRDSPPEKLPKLRGFVSVKKPDEFYGYITGSDGIDYFFHGSALKNIDFAELELQDEVVFTPLDTPKGPRAVAIELDEDIGEAE